MVSYMTDGQPISPSIGYPCLPSPVIHAIYERASYCSRKLMIGPDLRTRYSKTSDFRSLTTEQLSTFKWTDQLFHCLAQANLCEPSEKSYVHCELQLTDTLPDLTICRTVAQALAIACRGRRAASPLTVRASGSLFAKP
jgi:hypothetical protein